MKIKDLKVNGHGLLYYISKHVTYELFPQNEQELQGLDRYFNSKYGNRELTNFCFGFIRDDEPLTENEINGLAFSIYSRFIYKWKELKITFDLDAINDGEYSYTEQETTVDDGNVAGLNNGTTTYEHTTSGYDSKDYVDVDKDQTATQGNNTVKTDNNRMKTLERKGHNDKQNLKTNNLYFLNKYSLYDIIFLDIVDEISYLI